MVSRSRFHPSRPESSFPLSANRFCLWCRELYSRPGPFRLMAVEPTTPEAGYGRQITVGIVAIALMLCTATKGIAQSAPDSTTCLGFAFGAWTPKLDWRAAGHGVMPDSIHLGQAPAGRGWAEDLKSGRDSVLVLFPAWWPAGVRVDLPNRSLALGDTVRGTATAFIAYGDRSPPTSKVRAWAVPCGRGSR